MMLVGMVPKLYRCNRVFFVVFGCSVGSIGQAVTAFSSPCFTTFVLDLECLPNDHLQKYPFQDMFLPCGAI